STSSAVRASAATGATVASSPTPAAPAARPTTVTSERAPNRAEAGASRASGNRATGSVGGQAAARLRQAQRMAPSPARGGPPRASQPPRRGDRRDPDHVAAVALELAEQAVEQIQ